MSMVEGVKYELISWSETERLCIQLAKQIKASGFTPDIVVAIGRGGYVPARLLCDHLDIMALTSIKIELYGAGSNKNEKAVIKFPLCHNIHDMNVLLVDDVNDSGETLELATTHLNTFEPHAIKIAVIHHKTCSQFSIDYFAKKIIKWRWLIYPWAVHEDISGFLRQPTPYTDSLEQSQQYLADNYNIRLSKKRLQQIIDLMKDSAH